MCGRFTLASGIEIIATRFNVPSQRWLDVEPRYNIAPSQPILAIVNDGKDNRLGYLKWGLVPPWSKDPKVGYKMINARAETLNEKPSFRQAYKKRRCLIVADSFYEWKREGKTKIPKRITVKNGLFAMAGLWEKWTSANGENIHSCTIITTKPNELMEDIHDRMPVILNKDEEQLWLDRSIEDTYILNELLDPYPAEKIEAYTVSSSVNSPKNDGPELVQPVI